MAFLVAWPAHAFHVHAPNQPITDNICAQQPLILGVNTGGNPSLQYASHLGWMRMTLRWSDIEPSQNVFTFPNDSAINAAVSQGIKILAILSTAPAWAGGGAYGNTPPSNIALWQTFVGAVAQHYRGKIIAYEIWNEPNLQNTNQIGVGWDRDVNSSPLYVDYLHVAAQQIRSNAPGTLVVGPVLSTSSESRGSTIFAQIEAASYSDGPGSSFLDVVSFHANGANNDGVQTSLDNVAGHLSQITASNVTKPIWITEFGWDTSYVSQTTQEQNIANFVLALTGENNGQLAPCFGGGWQWYKFTNMFIFDLQDGPGDTRGIFTSSGAPKQTVTGYTATFPFPAELPCINNSKFTYSCTGRTCTFTNPYTQNESYTIYIWDYGDGTTLMATGAAGRVVMHTFPAAGTYFFVGTGADTVALGNLNQADVQLVTVH
jgi:hypothetical protein